MADREKVIKGLEGCFEALVQDEHAFAENGVVMSYWQDRAKRIDAIREAIALLKAQEPVKPVVDKNTSTGECEDPWGRLFFCGACGKRINEKYDPDEDDKYCKHCGREVKWE